LRFIVAYSLALAAKILRLQRSLVGFTRRMRAATLVRTHCPRAGVVGRRTLWMFLRHLSMNFKSGVELMRTRGRSLFILAGLLSVASTYSRGAELYAVTLELNVPVKMRDGVVLRADIYRPESKDKFPVLLERTPYNKQAHANFGVQAAARGYVVVMEDVRGRYTSEGEWYPFKSESQDGYDTIEWAAALPNSNGKVGMLGASYNGAAQMLAAIARPPHLAGICPIITGSNYHDGWTYQGGAFELWFNGSWTTGLAQDTVNRYLQSVSNAMEGVQTLPLPQYPLFNLTTTLEKSSLTSKFAPYYLDWIAHPNFDDYWRRWSIEDHYADIQVPALTIAGWYDIFQGGALRNYLGIKTHGGSEAARQNQRLVIMAGGHAGTARKIGDLDLGSAAEVNYDQITLDWYDFLFKGMKNDFITPKPVKIFVMGTNVWRDEEAWPLARAITTKYFLHSGGRANSIRGDGVLSEAAPPSEVSDQYVYDPSDPAPTIGGPLCCDVSRFPLWSHTSEHLLAGPRDQRPVELRNDVLVYSAAPFARDTEVTGPVSVELYAKSSALDTDFTAKLVDVWPNGFAQNLTEGILRARFRDSQSTPTLLVPGQLYKFNIDLWSTSNVFLAGHTLRLEISSSNFPRFDRNPNTGEDPRVAEHEVKATNTIAHDREHPSVLILPVLPQ
jgi:putative CocE/NonD family hydrolase